MNSEHTQTIIMRMVLSIIVVINWSERLSSWPVGSPGSAIEALVSGPHGTLDNNFQKIIMSIVVSTGFD